MHAMQSHDELGSQITSAWSHHTFTSLICSIYGMKSCVGGKKAKIHSLAQQPSVRHLIMNMEQWAIREEHYLKHGHPQIQECLTKSVLSPPLFTVMIN